MTPVRLEPAALRSRVKHSTTPMIIRDVGNIGNLQTRGWTGGTQSPLPSPFYPTSLPLSPHFPPPLPPTSLPLQPHFPPPVRFFPPPDKILFLFMNLSVAKNQN